MTVMTAGFSWSTTWSATTIFPLLLRAASPPRLYIYIYSTFILHTSSSLIFPRDCIIQPRRTSEPSSSNHDHRDSHVVNNNARSISSPGRLAACGFFYRLTYRLSCRRDGRLSLTCQQKASKSSRRNGQECLHSAALCLVPFPGRLFVGSLECLPVRDECLLRERVANRLKTISTNIL